MHEEDRDLAKRMAKGRDDAFRLFFDRYFPRVYRFCCRRLDAPLAEEVTQSVLVSAIRHISGYRGEASLFTWLCQMARHEIGSHYRRQSRQIRLVPLEDAEEIRGELESLAADLELAPEPALARSQRQALVHLILDHLPGDYGQLLEWKYIEGYSVEEIAARLKTTPTATQSMLARARSAFRNQYQTLSAEALPFAATDNEAT